MIPKEKLALNRIVAPKLSLRDFFTLSRETGIPRVELRNDLQGGLVIDNLKPQEARSLSQELGVSILTINAVQKFNLASARSRVLEELKRLLDLSVAIGCSALVLCPNNEKLDTRPKEQIKKETIDALAVMGPLFQAAGVTGLVEPLGFAISSLSSAREALEMVRSSGYSCYKLLLDTFHHYLGPDVMEDLGTRIPPAEIGLVHVSGVEDSLPPETLLDEHRVFPSAKDRMRSKEQGEKLYSAGYQGYFSFEPFSSRIQNLPLQTLKETIIRSVKYLTGP